MPQVSIWMSDELHEAVKAAEFNLSGVCQAAARAALVRRQIMTTLTSEATTVEWHVDGRRKRFTGRKIAEVEDGNFAAIAYFTARERIAVVTNHGEGTLDTYDDFEEFADECQNLGPLVAQVAEVLGEDWVEDLDI